MLSTSLARISDQVRSISANMFIHTPPIVIEKLQYLVSITPSTNKYISFATLECVCFSPDDNKVFDAISQRLGMVTFSFYYLSALSTSLDHPPSVISVI